MFDRSSFTERFEGKTLIGERGSFDWGVGFL